MNTGIRACCGVEGWYTLSVGKLDENGNLVPRSVVGPFKNLITNQGLNRMGAESNWIGSCQVGEGSSTPAVTDTGLDNYLAGTSTLQSDITTAGVSADFYTRRRRVYRFAEGVAAGNLSEVGVGWATSGAVLYSRALIVDGGGTPITITVLSDEILDVTYEARTYPPLDDVTGTVNISGDDYDYTVRAANVTTDTSGFAPGWSAGAGASNLRPSNNGHGLRSGTLAPITSIPTGNISAGAVTVSNAAYSDGTLRREGTLTWGLGGSAVTSVIYCFNFGAFQIEFDPVLPKSAANELSLTFFIEWDRRTI